MAQTITITGKVSDEKGASVAGATVTEKGTRNATTTIDDGTFTLQVKNKAKLVISYVGYEPYEVEAKAGLKVSLVPSSQALTDVVVEAAVTALLLAFAIQAHKRFGTLDPHELVQLKG